MFRLNAIRGLEKLRKADLTFRDIEPHQIVIFRFRNIMGADNESRRTSLLYFHSHSTDHIAGWNKSNSARQRARRRNSLHLTERITSAILSPATI